MLAAGIKSREFIRETHEGPEKDDDENILRESLRSEVREHKSQPGIWDFKEMGTP